MSRTYVTICGNVTAAPEVRPTRSGEPFATFRIAVNPRRKDPKLGVWVNMPASFYNVTAFNNLAINVLNCVRKGQPVVVHGELRVSEFEVAGKTQRAAEITAESIGHDLKFGSSEYVKVSHPMLAAANVDGPPSYGDVGGPGELANASVHAFDRGDQAAYSLAADGGSNGATGLVDHRDPDGREFGEDRATYDDDREPYDDGTADGHPAGAGEVQVGDGFEEQAVDAEEPAYELGVARAS